MQPNLEKTQTPSDALGGTETILVVENEEPVRRFVCEVLQQHGYQVHSAGNGAEALEVWENAHREIDLLLTDVVMAQEISGFALAERLLQDRGDLRVIYTSGYSAELVDRHLGSHDHVNFLAKPYHPLKLPQTVRTCLDS